MTSPNITIFKCKDCGVKVIYTPEIVKGVIPLKDRTETIEEDIVYLTCPKGHTNFYTIPAIQ